MIKAIIFDLDGVLVSTDEFHYLAWKKLADNLNIPFNREINNLLRGVSRMDSLNIILKNCDKNFTEEEKLRFCEIKNAEYVRSLSAMSQKDVDGKVFEVLKKLKEDGFKLAIGSSSRNAKTILTKTELIDYFDVLTDGNCISHSKPDPEVFIKAAEMLCVSPKNCVVVEDAISGIEAARRAEMKNIAIGNAAKEQAGDYNINCIDEIPDILNHGFDKK